MPTWIIKPGAIAFICWSTFAWQPAHADPQCRIIGSFGDLHDAHIRLRDHADAGINRATFDTLNFARDDLGSIDLNIALGSNMSTDDKAVLAAFLQVTDGVSAHLMRGNLSAARQLLGEPTVRQMTDAVATMLRTLSCSDEDRPPIVTLDADQVAGLQAFRAGSPTLWALATFIFGAAVIWLLLRHRSKQRRRGRRYSANYITQYESDGNTVTGTLLDISGSGAKLRHDPLVQPIVGAEVEITIDGAQITANVMWNNPHYTGLRFQKPLPSSVVQLVHTFRKGQVAVPHKKTAPPGRRQINT